MAKRVVIDPETSVQQPGVAPAASPVNTYYTPKLPAVQLAAVVDLSGLSDSLAKVALSQKARQNEIDTQEIQAFLGQPEQQAQLADVTKGLAEVKDAEAAREKLIKASADAVRGKKMPFENSPWLPVIYQQMGAQKVMQAYREDLFAQLPAMSKALDPQTGLPVDPTAPEKIVQDTWKKYASNGILSGFYGSKVQNALKTDTEEAFHKAAGAQIGQAQSAAYKQWATDSVTSAMKEQASKPTGMTDLDKGAMKLYLEQTFHKWGLGPDEVAATVRQSADAAAAFVAKGDDPSGYTHAAAFLEDLRSVKYGNSTLGAMTEVSQYIDKKQEELHNHADSAARKQFETEDLIRSSARADASGDFLTWRHADPKRMNMGAAEAFTTWADAVRADPAKRQKWGDSNVEAAIEASRQAFARSEDVQFANPATEGALKLLMANSKVDGPTMKQIILGSDLTSEKKAQLIEDVTTKDDVNAKLSKAREFTSAIQDLDQSVRVSFGTLVQTQDGPSVLEEAQSPIRAWENQMIAFARKAPAGDNGTAISDEVARTLPAVRASVKSAAEKAQLDISTARQAIQDQIDRHQDATKILAQNRRFLSVEDFDRYSRESAVQSDLHQQFTSIFDPNREMEQLVAERLKADNDGQAVAPGSVDDAVRAAQAKSEEWLHQYLVSPAYRPGDAKGLFVKKATEFAKEAIAERTTHATAAEKPAQTITEQEKASQDIVRAENAARSAADAVGRGDRDSAGKVFAQWFTMLPENEQNKDMIEAAQEWVSAKTPSDRAWNRKAFEDALGSSTTGLHQSFWGGYTANSDQELSDKVRAQHVVNGYSLTGMPLESVLSGKLPVQVGSDRFVSQLQVELKTVTYGPLGLSENNPRVLALKSMLKPQEPVDIGTAKIPFTARISDFKTAKDIDSFVQNQPEKALALMARLGVDQNPQTVTKWAEAQKRMLSILQ